MLLFSIFHVFFSHQHVQMITGPHEKKWCGNFFWGPFLNKINFFKNYARGEDIILGRWNFNTTIRWGVDNFWHEYRDDFQKKLQIDPPYCAPTHARTHRQLARPTRWPGITLRSQHVWQTCIMHILIQYNVL